MHYLQDIIFQKSEVTSLTWPWPRHLERIFVNTKVILYMANQCTKFEVSSLSHSSDILEGLKIYKLCRYRGTAWDATNTKYCTWKEYHFLLVSTFSKRVVTVWNNLEYNTTDFSKRLYLLCDFSKYLNVQVSVTALPIFCFNLHFSACLSVVLYYMHY